MKNSLLSIDFFYKTGHDSNSIALTDGRKGHLLIMRVLQLLLSTVDIKRMELKREV